MFLAGVIWIAWQESEFASRTAVLKSTKATPTVATTTTHGAVTREIQRAVTATASLSDSQSQNAADSDPEAPGSRQHPFTTADVRKMIAPYMKLTSFEAKDRTNRYLGRWLKVDASLVNADRRDSHDFFVVAMLNDGPEASNIFIVTHLNDSTAPSVRTLHRNEAMVVMGKIEELGVDVVKLKDCELISP
jgi:tRNA_anti-like